jgi:hypothetical protein
MMTNIRMKGSSDINMPPSPPRPGVCANAGEMNIDYFLAWFRDLKAGAPDPFFCNRFRADYSGHRPNCNAARDLKTAHFAAFRNAGLARVPEPR